jgi:glycosyltransferase involved in cell wall biosynthesis
MKIGIDVSFLARDRSGMGRVTRNIIDKFLELFDHEFFFVLVKHKTDEKAIRQLFPGNVPECVHYTDSTVKNLEVIWFPWNRIDFLPACRRVATIHDVAPYRFSNSRRGSEAYNDRKRIKHASEASDSIITPSEFSKSEICTFLEVAPEKIEVIPHGVEDSFALLEIDRDKTAQLLDTFSKGLPYILFVGNVEKRKNVEVLLEAFGKAKKEYTFPHKLVIAGKVPRVVAHGDGTSRWSQVLSRIGIAKNVWKNHLVALAEKLAIKDDVIWLGEIDDEKLVYLYNLAKLFVFPSFYEGFGLPLLEAMACGVPCIASDVPALAEVGGDAVVYFDPRNAGELSQKLWEAISDSELSAKLRKAGIERAHQFRWEISAHKHMKILEAL